MYDRFFCVCLCLFGSVSQSSSHEDMMAHYWVAQYWVISQIGFVFIQTCDTLFIVYHLSYLLLFNFFLCQLRKFPYCFVILHCTNAGASAEIARGNFQKFSSSFNMHSMSAAFRGYALKKIIFNEKNSTFTIY
jgi:hypothetical protein